MQIFWNIKKIEQEIIIHMEMIFFEQQKKITV